MDDERQQTIVTNALADGLKFGLIYGIWRLTLYWTNIDIAIVVSVGVLVLIGTWRAETDSENFRRAYEAGALAERRSPGSAI